MSQKERRYLGAGLMIALLLAAGNAAAQVDTLTTRYDNRTLPTASGITNGVTLGMGSGIQSAYRYNIGKFWYTQTYSSVTNTAHFHTTVGAPIAAISANTFLGQVIDPPEGAAEGVAPVIVEPPGGGSAIWIDYAGIVIATGTGQIEIEWTMDGGGTERKYYTISVSSSKRPVRMYWTHKRPASTESTVPIVPLQNAGPTIQFSSNYRVDLHGNNAIEIYDADAETVGDVRLNGTELYAFENARGSFLITYSRLDELTGRRELLAFEVVDVMEPMSTEQPVAIGDQLKPLTRPFSTDTLFPQVTRGMVDESGRNEIYVYQHMSGPQKDWLYAIRDTVGKAWKIEVYWRAKEELDVLWPFEVDIYEASWGANVTPYARDAISGTPSARPDPKVFFPANLAVAVMDYQVPSAHVVVENGAFYTTSCGSDHYALMKYTSGDLVWFESIQSLAGTDEVVYTGEYEQTIPEIIIPPSPFAESTEDFFYPGWIRTVGSPTVPVRNPYNIYTYSYPAAYTPTNQLDSTIFPVNAGVLNVYWSNPSRCNNLPTESSGYVEPLPAPIYIPGVTADYRTYYPAHGEQQSDTPTQILIASGQGSTGGTLSDFGPVRGNLVRRLPSAPNGIMAAQLHGGVPSEEFTFEAWLKINMTSVQIELIHFTHPNGAETNNLFSLGLDEGNLLLNGVNLTEWSSFPEEYNPLCYDMTAAEKWHHVAVSKTAEGLLSYYLNGYLAAQFSDINLSAVHFGEDLFELFAGDNIAFDNVRLWNTARSWKQLYQGRYAPVAQPDDTLAAQYLCDALWDTVSEMYKFPMIDYLQDSSSFGNHLPFPAESMNDFFQRGVDEDGALAHAQPGMEFGGGDAALYVQRDRALDGYNPNEEHAMLMSGIAFALRTDLNETIASEPEIYSSEPFVLVQYTDEDTGNLCMKALQVIPENDMYRFTGFMEAGQMVQAPMPISLLQPANWHEFVSGPVLTGEATCFRDRKDWFWAHQAGDDGGHTNYVFDFSYPNQPGFDYPGAATPPEVGTRIPWMPGYTGRGDGFPLRDAGDPASTPINYTFYVQWPEDVPGLYVGDTLTTPKNDLPAVRGQLSVNVLYQQSEKLNGAFPSVHLIDPTRAGKTAMEVVPGAIDNYRDVRTGYTLFPDLPPMLRDRIYWNPMAEIESEFQLKGEFRERTDGHNYLLLNVMDERNRLSALNPELVTGADDPDWTAAINDLPRGAADLIRILDDETPFDSLALATDGRGAGYVTLVFNDSRNEAMVAPSESIFMTVIRVEPELYQGRLDPILSDNPLDKQMNLKYTADFGGSTERWVYEWNYADPENGRAPATDSAAWTALLDSEGGYYLDFATIGDAGVFGLSDHYVRCRYRALDPAVIALVGEDWSTWTPPQLAEGWIKRVLKAVNPFEQRIRDYMNVELNTELSMIQQAGSPYNGNVPLNMEALNDYGLIPIYETLLRESKKLSIDADNPSAGSLSLALQMAAGRISELFMVLGNEAVADAMSPTIDLGSDSPVDDSAESSIFCFQNQTRNLLEEELALLRGRDLSWEYAELPPQGIEPFSYPLFNRLAWNFTADIMGGEVAYALNYGITDLKGNNDGSVNAKDAEMLFPQGHGDAYGHYLSAIKGYYYLLRQPYFGWLPQVEGILAGETEVTISYFHEKRFAMAAAAKAKTAEMIVSRTWRDNYESGMEDAWLLAEDDVDNRDWGNDEWATRGHLAAYYDWAVANALLPARESDERGIRIIDREGTPELGEIATAARRIQRIADQADSGMNPLGLADNAIPFDISPSEIDAGKTHFEQIQTRALRALDNAAEVYGRVKAVGNALRDQNESRDFDTMVADEEAALNRRLIEVYGYPYADDIGPGKNYAEGYNGPDLLNYLYVDLYDLDNNLDVHGRYFNMAMNRYEATQETITGSFQAAIDTSVGDLGYFGNMVAGAITFTEDAVGQGVNYLNQWIDIDQPQLPVTIVDTGADTMDGQVNYTFNVTSWSNNPVNVRYYVAPYGFPGKPPEYTGQRRAEGEIQIALAGYAEQLFAIQQAYEEAASRTESVRSKIEELRAFEFGNQMEIPVRYANAEVAAFYAAAQANAQAVADTIEMLGKVKDYITEAGVEVLPKMAGFSTDFTSLGRAAVLALRAGVEEALGLQVSEQKAVIAEIREKVKSIEEQMEEELAAVHNSPERSRMLSEIRLAAHEVGAAVAALESTLNLANATRMRFVALESEGDQLQMERERLRMQWSSDLNTRRYRNMMYQIMRNDELQRYNEAFETAARYCYLAARAYDYETGMLASDAENTAGRDFMTQIVKTRSLGRFAHDSNGYGAPLGGGSTGDPGLADVMYRLDENWQVLKSRLGFNNPQSDVDAFSLRRECFRKVPDAAGDAAWQDVLEAAWVSNLRDLPAFQRLCQPFDPMTATEPGFAIPFVTTIEFRKNFFGQDLAAGDNAFDSTYFSTKLRGIGVCLDGGSTGASGLALRPQIYIVPAGLDAMRVPIKASGMTSTLRTWSVLDQVLPLPYPLSDSQWEDPDWSALKNLCGNELFAIRKYPSLRAYLGNGFDASQMSYNARLVGRSVWNSQWWIIIPAGSLNADDETARERFVEQIKDIRLYLKTYSFSGN